MLSEVVGNKAISFGASTGGAGATALSQANYRRIKPMPSISTDMPPPRNPYADIDTAALPSREKRKVSVQDLNEFFVCFLCKGYKIEATTINECMHSCKYPVMFPASLRLSIDVC